MGSASLIISPQEKLRIGFGLEVHLNQGVRGGAVESRVGVCRGPAVPLARVRVLAGGCLQIPHR